jgi:hypothetical protein
MDMIGHEAVTNQRHSVKLNVLPQQGEVGRTIRIAIQDEAPAVPRWVKWCGASTATTRANRPTAKKQYQKTVCTAARVKINNS